MVVGFQKNDLVIFADSMPVKDAAENGLLQQIDSFC
jgi:hypothetical protein